MMTRKIIALTCVLCMVFAFTAVNGAEAKKVRLKFTTTLAPKGPTFAMFKKVMEEIKTRSNGKIDYRIYHSGTLTKAREHYKGVVDGVADMTWTIHALTPGKYHLIPVMALPFMSPSIEVGTAVLTDLAKEFPEIRAEHADVKLMYLWGTLPIEIHTTKKPVRTLEDMKGMKIACVPPPARTLKTLGASPVVMPPTDMYQALEKGVVDGVAVPYGWLNGWRFYEVTKYHTNAHIGANTGFMVIGKKKYESLSPDLQKVINDVAPLAQKWCVEAVSGEKIAGIENCKKKGNEIIELSPAELARWKAAAQPITDAWIKKTEAKGLPASKIYKRAVELVNQHNK